MSFLTSEIKKPLYWGLAWVLTFINFVTFIVSRNEFWLTHPVQAWLAASVTEDRTYIASEFERNITCYAPLTCFRSGGAFISQTLIEVTTAMSGFISVSVNSEQETFIILLVGLMWRVACLTLFLTCMSRVLESLRSALGVTNCLMFVLGGLPLWTLGKAIIKLPIGLEDEITKRASDAFYFMSFQDLQFYDYGFIAIVPLTMLALAKIDDISKLSIKSLFLIGFLTATFYEAFVPIIFLSALIFSWRTSRKIQLSLIWLVVSQLVWIIVRTFSIRFTEANDPVSQFFTDTSFFGIFRSSTQTGASTKGSLISILIQLCFIAAVAAAAGVVVSLIIAKFRSSPILNEKTLCAVTTTAFVTTIIISLSFLRPIYVETGRQSLGLTVAVVIYSFAGTQNFLAKAQAKRSTASSSSV
jgi:hypothetical protein